MNIDSRSKILTVDGADLEERLQNQGYCVCGHTDNYVELKPLRTRDLDAAIQMAKLLPRMKPLSTELRGCRVLVLESDPGLRRLLVRVLLREGVIVSDNKDEHVCFDLVVGGDGSTPARATLTLTDFEDGRPTSLSKPFGVEAFLAKVKEIVTPRS